MKNGFGVGNGTVEKSGSSMRNHNNDTNSEQSSSCCSMGEGEFKIYQAFIFSIPVFFTFVLLFSFCFFYLRHRRRSRTPSLLQLPTLPTNQISRPEQGLKKELREMLPIIVFMESFSVSDTQCSVCLGDYQANDRLQQIPACGHTFHVDCIDQWLTAHTTCPLCRLSLLASAKSDILEEETTTASSPSNAESPEDPSIHNCNPSDDRNTAL